MKFKKIILVLSILNIFSCDLILDDNLEKVNLVTSSHGNGTYQSSIEVILATSTSNAEIYYTIDSTVTSDNALLYTSPIILDTDDSTVEINTFASKSGMKNSDVSTFRYIMNFDKLSNVLCNLVSNTYNSDIEIELSHEEDDSIIYYTMDSSDPTTESEVYTNPIILAGDNSELEIKAIAVRDGNKNSNILTRTFTINYAQLSLVDSNYESNTYNNDLEIELSHEEDDTIIYYTTDSSEPTIESEVYTNPIILEGDNSNLTIKTFATKSGMKKSDTKTINYEIKYLNLNIITTGNGIITKSLDGDNFEKSTEITLTSNANENNYFSGWIIDGEKDLNSTIVINMTDNITIEALFRDNDNISMDITASTNPCYLINQNGTYNRQTSLINNSSVSVEIISLYTFSSPGVIYLYTDNKSIIGDYLISGEEQSVLYNISTNGDYIVYQIKYNDVVYDIYGY